MVTLPSDLVVQDGEQHFLKILGSHRAVCKLVCPCTSKTIKKHVHRRQCQLEDLARVALERVQPQAEPGYRTRLVRRQEGATRRSTRKRKLSAILPCTTKTVTLPSGKEACFMMSSLKSAPAVLLQEPDLANLVEYLAEDCDSCACSGRRGYHATVNMPSRRTSFPKSRACKDCLLGTCRPAGFVATGENKLLATCGSLANFLWSRLGYLLHFLEQHVLTPMQYKHV